MLRQSYLKVLRDFLHVNYTSSKTFLKLVIITQPPISNIHPYPLKYVLRVNNNFTEFFGAIDRGVSNEGVLRRLISTLQKPAGCWSAVLLR